MKYSLQFGNTYFSICVQGLTEAKTDTVYRVSAPRIWAPKLSKVFQKYIILILLLI